MVSVSLIEKGFFIMKTQKTSPRSRSKKGTGGSVLDRFTAKELTAFSPEQLAVMSGQTPAVAVSTETEGTAPITAETAPSGFANKMAKALKTKGTFTPEGSTYIRKKDNVECTINATAGTLRIKGDGNGKLVFMSAKRFVEIQNDPDLIKAGELLIKAYPELVS